MQLNQVEVKSQDSSGSFVEKLLNDYNIIDELLEPKKKRGRGRPSNNPE